MNATLRTGETDNRRVKVRKVTACLWHVRGRTEWTSPVMVQRTMNGFEVVHQQKRVAIVKTLDEAISIAWRW